MSGVDVLRAAFDAWKRGGTEELTAFLAPDIEWRVRSDLPDAGLYRGHEGVRRLSSRFDEVMEEIWFEPQEFIALEDGRFLVPLTWGGRGKGSGVDFEESRETWIFTTRGGLIARIDEFGTREEALEATARDERHVPRSRSCD